MKRKTTRRRLTHMAQRAFAETARREVCYMPLAWQYAHKADAIAEADRLTGREMDWEG